jgi:hypothetical protein
MARWDMTKLSLRGLGDKAYRPSDYMAQALERPLDTSDAAGAQLPAQGGRAHTGWHLDGDLTPLEEEMIAGAAGGRLVDRGEGPFNLTEMQAWTAERTIRAEVLRHLLVAGQWPLDEKGVRLRGLRISGHLDLEAAVLRCSLSLDCCYFDAVIPVCLDFATASRVTLTGCHLAGLTGEMLTARELDLSNSTFTGPLQLLVAHIVGQLNCRGAWLAGHDSEGNALNADRLKAGAVYLSEGFTAPGGAVRLLGADITGPLICRGAMLNGGGKAGISLGADGLRAGDVFLDGGFTATGAVMLKDAHITGQLSCRGAKLIGADHEGNALIADRLKAAGGAFLDEGFSAAGAVRLLGADITGQLSLRGARLAGRDSNGDALIADWLKTAGGVFLSEGFTAAGAVRLLGADIIGHLDCSGAHLTGRDGEGNALIAEAMKAGTDVFLDKVLADAGAIRMTGANITGALSFRGAHLSGRDSDGNALIADRLKVGGGVSLDEGFSAAGAIRLLGADITGQLSCQGANLTGSNSDGSALIADGITVRGGAFLNHLIAAGAVRLVGADINTQLTCWGAQLIGRNSHGDALAAHEMKVRGSVLLNEVYTATGAIRLTGADISGPLACSHAELSGRDNVGNALIADRMRVGSGMSLDDRFTAAGAIRLAGADIAGQLTCRGARITGRDDDGDSLAAYGMKVSDRVFLDDGFSAVGTVSFASARFGGSVEFKPAALAGQGHVALDMADAWIAGALWWAPATPVTGRVDLEGAAFGELADDWGAERESANGYWPTAGLLRLNGLTYDKLGGNHQPPVEQRLEWVRGQYSQNKRRPTALWTNGIMAPPVIVPPLAKVVEENGRSFASEPYDQLAKVYRQTGRDSDARKVAIARRVDERRYSNLNPYRMLGNWFFDKTIKFGYQTWRAALGLVIVFVAFLVMSLFAQHHHAIVPVGDLAADAHPFPVATRCAPSYPCFYPVGYAVDVVIPVINVHQAEFWGLDGWGWVVGSWAATSLGWATVTLLIVGYTGLVRQQ